MKTTFLRFVLPTLGLAMGIQGVSLAKETISEPLLGKEWQSLAMVTGFHALANRELGLEMRVLEVDGSARVAENPITLFIVAINGGNPDPEEHLWRLPIQVAEVRKAVVKQGETAWV